MACRIRGPFHGQQGGLDPCGLRHSLACPEGPGFCPSGQRGDGRYSALAAAELLNVNVSTIADWCNSGRLESVRAGTHGPRWITLTPEIIAELRKPVQRHWKRRRSRQREQNMVQ